MVSKTKQISEGAMMIAMIGIFLLINRQTANFLEDAISWLISLPMIVYCTKYGLKASLIVCVSCLLLSFMIAAPTTIFYLFSALIVGVMYGYGVSKKWKNAHLLILCIIMQLITMLITVLVLSEIFGYNILSEFRELLKIVQSVETIENSKTITGLFLLIIYIGTSILQGILIHVVAHILLKRLHVDVLPLKQLQEVVFPKWMAYFVGISWLLYMLSSLGMFDKTISSYVFMVYAIAFIIGVSSGLITLLTYAMKEQKRSLIFISMVLCFVPGINNLILWLGIYDMFTGFHQKIGSR
ncbi:uncharacterized protein YybS (DUF2232 family) [Breznakia sp. PF5-3]|uniref:DUF2232 domain-containing protein n=1 Tax=unclassified Breznakia TaxID=2623764 RepID=UPI002407265A|nr:MULTISPECIES: DUF2232 domain-containing protein [unclassified Breznakia]MDL2276937.1 YybS family protein [Breznakia sp. OttesenSCG-928-G09]MDF9824786.1 uncharacterized protein YybS (DUF2232 family) [Breznakia sp. PM6-1]MDF9835758.1 uncharacterized protein YybS (DUF2232 family) [Breznakia sp. PF5-3]MDF9837844.1 uncharacterized protein YybS (DUF2232 family) [Breznakia sp. PFB2-8]MDF9859785.1 uncharacterized protein YybS (DUF2232 family) [Breznakia sp. PH5-24]